jgi:phosphomethylpyrimidine synthase
MCGPKFCSMRITEQVRDYARTHGVDEARALSEGMQEKAREYREIGSPAPDRVSVQ